MRTVERAMIGLAILVIIIAAMVLSSFVEARGTSTGPIANDRIREETATEGCEKSDVISDIVNVSHCGIANKINTENGRIIIVKEIETE